MFFKNIYLLLIKKENRKAPQLTTSSFLPTTYTGSAQLLTGNRATEQEPVPLHQWAPAEDLALLMPAQA